MAGPVATYLATQQAAQTAFNVPFGLLAMVNNAITAATARGDFNVTVDCSLFVTEDVSNLRIYLDSLGYVVQFAKGTNEKGLNIDWGRFRDVPGTATTVFQGTSPWIIAGTVDQGAPGVTPWPVTISSFPGSITVTQGTTPWTVDGTVNVGNFPAVQPISGTVTALQGTNPWTVDGTVTANIGATGGLALDTTLTSGSQKSQIVNSSFVSVDAITLGSTPVDTDVGLVTSSIIYGHTTAGGGSYVEVKVTPSGALVADVSGSSVTVSGAVTATQGTSPWVVSGSVSVSNFPAVQPVSGAVTALQGTSPWVVSGTVVTSPDVNIHTSAGGNLTATGMALDVNVTNFPATFAVTQSTSPWVIAGTVTANAGTGNFTVVQATGTNLHAVIDSGNIAASQSGAWTTGRTWTLANGTDSVAAVQSGTWTVQQGTPPWSVSQSGTWTTGRTWALASGTDSVAAVQSGSWTVAGTGNFTVVQPTGTNLHTVLDSGTLTSITNALPAGTNVIGHVITDSGSTTVVTGNVTVVQPTGTNLHTVVDSGSITVNNAAGASAVNIQDGGNSITVDGTVTANQGTPAATANRWPVQVTDGTDLMIVDTDGSIFVKPVPVGTHGNAWNAATVSSGNNSATIDCQYVRTISIFGNSSSNLNPMRVQASQDNTNFFTLTTFAITAGNFGVTLDFGARYLRLQSGQGAGFTVTATVAGK